MALSHKVALKVPSYEDYAHFFEMRFLPEVTYWADDAHHELSLDEYALGRLVAQNEGEILERIITLDGEPIGTVTAREFVRRVCQCTLGVVIADPRYWGHGYGYDALKQFLVLLADEGIGCVILETYANNKRAQACFHKLGFQKRRVFFAPSTGRFVVQMVMTLSKLAPIGERILPGDPRWKPPRKS